MKSDRIAGIYAIIDPEAAPEREPGELARLVLAAGVKVVQLRAKALPAGPMLDLARALLALCREHGALFIVNDRLDVALAAGADGAHLGQDDLPLAKARGLAPDLIIGISTHSVAEARAARDQGADYIGFGAMYATATKANVTAPQGPERLREVVRAAGIPVVAIGGVTVERLPEIKSAGARAAAVISGLAQAADPQQAAREMIAAWERA